MVWPEYVENKSGIFRLLKDGERLLEFDRVCDSGRNHPDLFAMGTTARAGFTIGSAACSDWQDYHYYRRITDPLHIAMARALAATQPEDKAG